MSAQPSVGPGRRDLIAELTEASHRFDSHNQVPVDCELLDWVIVELKHHHEVERRAIEMRDQDGGGQRGSVERVTAHYYILTGEA